MIYPDPYGIFPGEYSTYCDRGFDVKIASTPRRPLYLKTCEVMQMEEMDDDVRLGAFDDNLVMFIPHWAQGFGHATPERAWLLPGLYKLFTGSVAQPMKKDREFSAFALACIIPFLSRPEIIIRRHLCKVKFLFGPSWEVALEQEQKR